MTDKSETYRTALKGIAIFGGVQFLLAIINIVRAKFTAIFLGTAGVGMLALFSSSINLVNQISSMGVSYSGVRDLAKASADKDMVTLSKTIIVVKRLLLITGLLGGVATLLFSKNLSLFAFDNDKYTWSFVWLSLAVLFNTLALGFNSLLQGMRLLKNLAKSSVIGAVIGLIVNVPFYYYFGLKGIVPAIVIASITTFALAFYYSRKIEVKPCVVTFQETLEKSKRIIKLGMALVFTGLVYALVAYLMNLYLQNTDGARVVGLYQAGLALTTQYVGLIFTAMATDYFPRLSIVRGDKEKTNIVANQQIQIAQLIIAPIAIVLILFANFAVFLLLSTEFYPTIPFIQFSLLGMLMKTACWAMTYIILSEGNTVLYLITETVIHFLILALNIIGYNIWGLGGIGVSFVISYAFALVFMWVIVHFKFQFSMDMHTLKLFSIQQTMLLFSVFLVTLVSNKYVLYSLGVTLIIVSVFYSLQQLDKLMSLRELIKLKFKMV